MTEKDKKRVAILYPGDREVRENATPDNNRLSLIFKSFGDLGVHAEPAVYHDDFCEEVRQQLTRVDAVLVWHNPIQDGRDRSRLDPMLREIAAAGVFVSTHPETIVRVRYAKKGSMEEAITLEAFFNRCEPYFAGEGRMIDQAYQPRLPEGMIRCYLVLDKVAGFGHQAINALCPVPPGAPPTEAPQPGPRLYHPPTLPEFQSLKRILEQEWVPAMQRELDLDIAALPILWNCDFLLGPRNAQGGRYLCTLRDQCQQHSTISRVCGALCRPGDACGHCLTGCPSGPSLSRFARNRF